MRYGTLFDVQGVQTAVAEVVARPEEFVADWRRRQLEYSWLRTLMNQYADFAQISLDALEATAEARDLDLTPALRARLLEAWLRPSPFPDVPAGLAALSAWPLGILSNGSPTMLRTVLDHTGLTDRFTWVLSVDAVRAFKRRPWPTHWVRGPPGFRAEWVLFVSSNGWDIAGAASFGFATCWINRTGAPLEHLGHQPGLVVQKLAEIAELLEPPATPT